MNEDTKYAKYLQDPRTGVWYRVYIENGRIKLEEVD